MVAHLLGVPADAVPRRQHWEVAGQVVLARGEVHRPGRGAARRVQGPGTITEAVAGHRRGQVGVVREQVVRLSGEPLGQRATSGEGGVPGLLRVRCHHGCVGRAPGPRAGQPATGP
jgi:hypothetical protein